MHALAVCMTTMVLAVHDCGQAGACEQPWARVPTLVHRLVLMVEPSTAQWVPAAASHLPNCATTWPMGLAAPSPRQAQALWCCPTSPWKGTRWVPGPVRSAQLVTGAQVGEVSLLALSMTAVLVLQMVTSAVCAPLPACQAHDECGGAVRLFGAARATISGATFEHNNAERGYGGGLCAYESSLLVTDASLFTGNKVLLCPLSLFLAGSLRRLAGAGVMPCCCITTLTRWNHSKQCSLHVLHKAPAL